MEGEVVTLQDMFVFEKRGLNPDGQWWAGLPPPASGRSSTRSCCAAGIRLRPDLVRGRDGGLRIRSHGAVCHNYRDLLDCRSPLCIWLYSRGRRASELASVKARLSGAADAKARSARLGAALIQTENLATGKVVLKLLLRMRLKERLRLTIEQAGLKWSVARTMHGCLALFLVAFTAVWYMAPSYRHAAPIAGAASGALPVCYALRRRRRRLKKLEEQFPAVLEFLSRAMRSGHAFSVSLEMIHSEFEEPISGEFKRVFDEHNLGMPLEAGPHQDGEARPVHGRAVLRLGRAPAKAHRG